MVQRGLGSLDLVLGLGREDRQLGAGAAREGARLVHVVRVRLAALALLGRGPGRTVGVLVLAGERAQAAPGVRGRVRVGIGVRTRAWCWEWPALCLTSWGRGALTTAYY